jgi:ABC-type multidrug transport system fused ATPase/permease subunit
MGLELVFQIVAHACLAFGVPMSLALQFSESPLTNMKNVYDQFDERSRLNKTRTKDQTHIRNIALNVPPIVKIIFAAVALGCLAAGAFLVYNNGNWNINGLPLSLWISSLVVFSFLIIGHFSPCHICESSMLTLSAVNLFVGVVLTAFFFSVSILPGIFGIVVTICYLAWCVFCFLEEEYCLRFARLDMCAPVISFPQ